MTHSPTSPAVFDNRAPLSKKSYFKCVLACSVLFDAGVHEFKSNRPKTFYDYLLKFHRLPPAAQSMKELNKYIDDNDASGDCPPALSCSAVVVVTEPIASDPDIACDEPTDVPLLPPQDVPLAPQDVIAADGDEEAVCEWPPELEGMKLRVVRAKHDNGYSYFSRLSVACPNSDHTNCSRSRSTQLHVSELGPKASLYYLGCWLQQWPSHEGEHKAYQPTMAEMRVYKASSLV